MSAAANRKLLLGVFRAIEQRDDKRFREQLRDEKLARAQMFYFDTVAVVHFLKKATSG